MSGEAPASKARRALCALGVALAAMLVATPSHAYCRTRTCEFRPDQDCEVDPGTGCSTVGEFVYWGEHCIPFAVQRDGSVEEEISADELDQLVANGFDTWTSVSCTGGGTPNLSAGSQGLIACDEVEYNCNDRDANSNIVMFRDDFVNAANGLRFGVIALTTLTANLVSGELFDADIEINSRDETFVIGEPPADSQARDLRGVINHELGHLLGLSHPNVTSALMYADYRGTVLPAEDDAAGMCAIRGGKRSDPQCDVVELPADTGCLGRDVSCKTQQAPPEEDSGCSLGAPAVPVRDRRWVLAGALFLACWLRRRR